MPPSEAEARPAHLLSFVFHPLVRAPWLWCVIAAVLCLIVAMIIFHGYESRQITRPTPQMDVESQFWVRVLLTANAGECAIRIPSAFRVQSDLGPDIQAGGTVMEPLRGPTKISLVHGRLMLDTIPLPGNEVVLRPESPYVVGLEDHDYRGMLKLIVNRDGQTFDIINLVPLEPYLAGVVGEEMPDYWEPQALRAQAIAARTYCLFIKNRFGVSRSYDVSRTQASQVYGGIDSESAQIWEVVNSTRGQILISPEPMTEKGAISDFGLRIADSTRRGNPQSAISSPQFGGLFPAYYSSICGGHTTGSDEVFGDSFGPLRGVPCPYCRDVARLGLFYWPMAQFDRQTVTRHLVQRYPKLGALGEIKDIITVEQSDCGQFSRLIRIRLIGATGRTDTLRAEDLRLAVDPSGRKLKSTVCHIVPWGNGWAFLSGRGWGHGVGMCQCGAEGMARQGSDAESILRYYYPGSRIVNIY